MVPNARNGAGAPVERGLARGTEHELLRRERQAELGKREEREREREPHDAVAEGESDVISRSGESDGRTK